MSERPPDVEMAASARAVELRFECVPEVRTRARSGSGASAGSHSERENLPDRVEPGLTYRDVVARWRLWARLEDDASEPPGGND